MYQIVGDVKREPEQGDGPGHKTTLSIDNLGSSGWPLQAWDLLDWGSHGEIWRKILLSRRNNLGKVPSAGMSLACLKDKEEAMGSRMMRQGERGDELESARSHGAFRAREELDYSNCNEKPLQKNDML